MYLASTLSRYLHWRYQVSVRWMGEDLPLLLLDLAITSHKVDQGERG